jgi:hypothetical protein
MSLLLPSHGPGSTPDGEYAYPRELNGLIGRGHLIGPADRFAGHRASGNPARAIFGMVQDIKVQEIKVPSRSCSSAAGLAAIVDPLSRNDAIQHENPGAERLQGLRKGAFPRRPA